MTTDVLRTAIMRIMSEMLDDPDDNGIYKTGRFMDRIEALLESMMAANDVMQLSGSEAVYGFVAWLSCSKANRSIGSDQDCAPWADLVEQFCNENHLSDPREEWESLLTHPALKGEDVGRLLPPHGSGP